VSCRHRDCRNPELTNLDIDNPPVDNESDHEKVNTGGELSILKKRKLDELRQPDNVDYNSDDSAEDSGDNNGGGKSIRHRKRRESPASCKTPPPNRPILDLNSQLPHDVTIRNSDDGCIVDERAVSAARPTSPSLQDSTALCDIEPSQDKVGADGYNQILDDPVHDFTEDEDDDDGASNEEHDSDNDFNDSSSDNTDNKTEDDDSDGGDDKGHKGHKNAERQRLSVFNRGGSTSKRATKHRAQQRRRALSMHESNRSTAPISDYRKRQTLLRGRRRYARRSSSAGSTSNCGNAASKVALNADTEEWPIRGFLRRKEDGLYTIEFSHQLPSPIDSAEWSRKPRANIRFTKEEDQLLIDLKEKRNLSWERIKASFPGRTVGSLQVIKKWNGWLTVSSMGGRYGTLDCMYGVSIH